MMAGTLTPSAEETVQLTALEVQVNFGDFNPKVHVEGFLTYVVSFLLVSNDFTFVLIV